MQGKHTRTHAHVCKRATAEAEVHVQTYLSMTRVPEFLYFFLDTFFGLMSCRARRARVYVCVYERRKKKKEKKKGVIKQQLRTAAASNSNPSGRFIPLLQTPLLQRPQPPLSTIPPVPTLLNLLSPLLLAVPRVPPRASPSAAEVSPPRCQ